MYKFDACLKSSPCKRCDIGYVLRNYIKPLIQTLTNDIRDYYMRLLTTKCLNTAVMLSVFMLGRKRGISIANYCDTEATRKRHLTDGDTNQSIIEYYSKDILSTRCKQRVFYYVLLTDGKFPYDEKTKEPAFFPGHVLILEKFPNEEKKPYFYFYQSYVNKYDLKEHIKKNNMTLKLSYNKTQKMLRGLQYILHADKWDHKCIKYWKDMTFVDSSNLLNSHCKNNIFLCIRKTFVVDCLKHIKLYTDQKLKELEKEMVSRKNDVYGDPTLYDQLQKPLTVNQMYKRLQKLKEDVKLRQDSIL